MGARQSSIVDFALKMVGEGFTPLHVAQELGIETSTLYRALRRQREAAGTLAPLKKKRKQEVTA